MFWTVLAFFMIQLVLAENEPQAAATTEKCPPLYTQWNDNCYRVFSSTNYGDADTSCRTNAFGGHLASIKSSAENIFVTTLIDSDTWIGFDDLAKEGDFYWTDGSVNGYKNWAPGEPNNKHDDEDCTYIYANGSEHTARWNDETCSDNLHYLCKVPLVP